MEEVDVYTPLYFQVSNAATSQLHSLLALQNQPDQFAFTDKVIVCSDGFIPFHGFLVPYFNVGEDSETTHQSYVNQQDEDHNAPIAAGSASGGVINMENYCVADVARAVLFLYVGTIALWPTSVVTFRQALIRLGCNPQRVQVMNYIEAMFYNSTTGSPAHETAGGKKLRFWSETNGIVSTYFVTANGSIVSGNFVETNPIF